MLSSTAQLGSAKIVLALRFSFIFSKMTQCGFIFPLPPVADTSYLLVMCSAPTSPYAPGTLINSRYEVLSLLGSGSIASVLECRDVVLGGQIVALKVLSSRFERDEVTRARFLREVTLGRQLAHPFIIRIFDYGALDNGLPFISMERVHGGSLRARLSQGCCDPKHASELFRQIVEALEYAHDRGVVHRDLKPDNVLLTDKGDVRITDFGTAKGEDNGQALTKTGEAIGTPLYMAPEVVKGRRADVRSDLYSLGAIGFELVMGKPPFQSDNWVVLAGMHVSTPPPPIDTPGVSDRYREAIARLLEKHPDARFQAAHQLREFLSSGPHNPGRHSWINMATGLAIGLMLGGVLGLFALKLWAAIH